MDNNREIRAMIFSVLHVPPLPAIMNVVDWDDNTVLEEGVESSHTLIGNMIDWIGAAKDHTKNQERMLEQFSVLAEFREDLLALNLERCTDEQLYNLYCSHTRKWLGCYSKLGATARFKPLEYVVVKDKIHKHMMDYCKAQYFHSKYGKETLALEETI